MTQELFEALAQPFPATAISWRVGSTNINKQTNEPPEGKTAQGLALAYLDSRDVQERLDDVCGPGGWQDDYPHAGAKTVCRIGVKIDGEWIYKSDGAGDTDVEAEKGALSAAFKRAAVKWGVGRYLYGLPSPWVTLEKKGRSWIIQKAEYAKLETLLEQYGDKMEWGTPGEVAMARALYQSVKSMVHSGEDVTRYREANAGVLANLRKKPREHIEGLLDQIAAKAAAAGGANELDERFRAAVGHPLAAE